MKTFVNLLATRLQSIKADRRSSSVNERDEQRKLIKYNHDVVKCLIFHNVQTLTWLLRQLADW